jgi:alkylation response protein AidB-like acyl-CoA dehydrogenase
VNFELSDEQVMLREAARGALARHDTLGAARAALDGEPLPDLWPVAVEAGWTGVLVPEEEGGAGLDVFDAMLVAQECGRRLAWAGLLGHFLATFLAPDERLASGAARGAAVLTASPEDAPDVRIEGDDAVVTGRVRFVPDAPGADVLIVAGRTGEGPVAVRLEGVDVEPVVRYDATRPLGHVQLDGARGTLLAAPAERIAAAWHLAQALLAAEAIGATEAPLELGVEYAKERMAFGRPIGSYQAVKHQLVEVLRHIETARSLSYYAGWAAEDRPDEFALAASAARYSAEHALNFGTRAVIAVHGGIGNTWEHDAPLYYRRAQLSRLLLGGQSGAGEVVARELLAQGAQKAAAAA